MLEQLGVYADEDFPRGKSLYCTSAPTLAELPTKLETPSRHFALLLAADATAWSDDDVLAVARELIGKGLAVLVAWGPGCERVHDLFDHARNPDESDDTVVLTTWHGDETLDEALWYFVGCAAAAPGFVDTCASWVAASINHPGWAEHMRGRVEGSMSLLDRSMADDDLCDSSSASHEEGDVTPPQA
jgi:hypothetical protein